MWRSLSMRVLVIGVRRRIRFFLAYLDVIVWVDYENWQHDMLCGRGFLWLRLCILPHPLGWTIEAVMSVHQLAAMMAEDNASDGRLYLLSFYSSTRI